MNVPDGKKLNKSQFPLTLCAKIDGSRDKIFIFSKDLNYPGKHSYLQICSFFH